MTHDHSAPVLRRRITAYDSVARRRLRQARRLAGLALRPSLYPRAATVGAFWWDGHPNFGDALTPWLLQRYGVAAVLTTPDRARVCGVGSILEQLPTDFDGTVWGSGLLWGKPVDLPRARFLAVRGQLTRDVLGLDRQVALGDPGLLVGRVMPKSPPRWTLGVVPHGMHLDSPLVAALAATAPREVKVIDPRRSPDVVLGQISRCAAIVSTSLHGLIAADSFGIPAAWTMLEPTLWGADFKFRDYESVVTPGRTRRVDVSGTTGVVALVAGATLADNDAVAASVAALEGAIPQIPAKPVLPFLAWRQR